MYLNSAAARLMHRFEGCKLEAYRCPAGVWTIGWGHTSSAGAPRVRPGMTITQQEADDIFRDDVERFAQSVSHLIKVELNGNQQGAIQSFIYNVGPGNFKKSSVLRELNRGNFHLVPQKLMLWNKARGKVLRGLTRRRAAEGELFMTPDPDYESQEQIEADNVPVNVEVQQQGTSPGEIAKSKTLWTTLGLGGAGGVNLWDKWFTVKPILNEAGDVIGSTGTDPWIIAISIVALAAIGFIAYERIIKKVNDGV